MSNLFERVYDEFCELSEKREKLEIFITSDEFNEISKAQQILLRNQHEIMTVYINILEVRLELLR